VAIVSASDPDIGQGGEVRYTLEGGGDGGEGIFSVDQLSGTIRTLVALDFEERQVHSLTVRARDRGSPSLSSDTNVIIEVVDVNENLHAPLFDDFVVSASIRENQPVGTLVTTVRATDADPPGDDSRVAYSIRGGDGIGLFSIDNEGKIQRFSIQQIKIFRDGTCDRRFLFNKTDRHTNFPNLFLSRNSTCFGQLLCPS
jgi:protocadherin Fat 1/2/3